MGLRQWLLEFRLIMRKEQYKKSIRLCELRDRIDTHLLEHPEDRLKQVYFDCLSMQGKFSIVDDNIIELY